MKNRRLFLTISLGIVLFAAAAAAAILLKPAETDSISVMSVDITPAPSPAQTTEPVQLMEPEEVLPSVPAPILYTKDGQCYMACGPNSIRQRNGKSGLSGNNRYMFCLDGFDIYKGFGTLIRVTADALSQPVTLAENVCSVIPSNGGTRALYMTDIKDGSGKLYLWDEKEGSTFIADNVLIEHLVFSLHATCFCYVVQEEGKACLYLNQGSGAVLIKAIKNDPMATDYYGNDHFNTVIPGDEGKVLYSLTLRGLNGWPLYLYSKGSTEAISGDAMVIKLLGTLDNIIYAEDVSAGWKLYYKEPGKHKVMLSDDFKLADFTNQPVSEKGIVFFLEEENDESMAMVDMYEATLSGQKELIAIADGGGLWSPNNKCVAYEREESFYVSRKTDKGWREERLCAVTYDEEANSSVESEFDTSGNYLYYYDYQNDRPLYRYSTADGTVNKVVNNARWFYIFGDVGYVIDSKGNAYRVKQDGSAERIGKKVQEIYQAEGGVYLTDEELGGNIYFVADGTAQSQFVDSCESIGSSGGEIEYQAPLGEDKDAAGEILYYDSDYYLSKIENYNGYAPCLTLEEDIALAEKLLGRNDLELEEIDYLTKMLEGFRLCKQWTEGDSDKKTEVDESLSAALDKYKSYVYGWTEEDYECDD